VSNKILRPASLRRAFCSKLKNPDLTRLRIGPSQAKAALADGSCASSMTVTLRYGCNLSVPQTLHDCLSGHFDRLFVGIEGHLCSARMYSHTSISVQLLACVIGRR